MADSLERTKEVLEEIKTLSEQIDNLQNEINTKVVRITPEILGEDSLNETERTFYKLSEAVKNYVSEINNIKGTKINESNINEISDKIINLNSNVENTKNNIQELYSIAATNVVNDFDTKNVRSKKAELNKAVQSALYYADSDTSNIEKIVEKARKEAEEKVKKDNKFKDDDDFNKRVAKQFEKNIDEALGEKINLFIKNYDELGVFKGIKINTLASAINTALEEKGIAISKAIKNNDILEQQMGAFTRTGTREYMLDSNPEGLLFGNNYISESIDELKQEIDDAKQVLMEHFPNGKNTEPDGMFYQTKEEVAAAYKEELGLITQMESSLKASLATVESSGGYLTMYETLTSSLKSLTKPMEIADKLHSELMDERNKGLTPNQITDKLIKDAYTVEMKPTETEIVGKKIGDETIKSIKDNIESIKNNKNLEGASIVDKLLSNEKAEEIKGNIKDINDKYTNLINNIKNTSTDSKASDGVFNLQQINDYEVGLDKLIQTGNYLREQMIQNFNNVNSLSDTGVIKSINDISIEWSNFVKEATSPIRFNITDNESLQKIKVLDEIMGDIKTKANEFIIFDNTDAKVLNNVNKSLEFILEKKKAFGNKDIQYIVNDKTIQKLSIALELIKNLKNQTSDVRSDYYNPKETAGLDKLEKNIVTRIGNLKEINEKIRNEADELGVKILKSPSVKYSSKVIDSALDVIEKISKTERESEKLRHKNTLESSSYKKTGNEYQDKKIDEQIEKENKLYEDNLIGIKKREEELKDSLKRAQKEYETKLKEEERLQKQADKDAIDADKQRLNNRRKVIDDYLNYQYNQKKYKGIDISNEEQLQKTRLAMREAEKTFGIESQEYDKAYKAHEKLIEIINKEEKAQSELIEQEKQSAEQAARKAELEEKSAKAYDYSRNMIKESKSGYIPKIASDEEVKAFADDLENKLNKALGNKEMQFGKKTVFDFSTLSDSDLRNQKAELQNRINSNGEATKEESKLLIALNNEIAEREHLLRVEQELNILTERRVALETKGNTKRGRNQQDEKELNNIRERENRLNSELNASKNIIAQKHAEAVAAQAAAEAEKKAKEEAAAEALKAEEAAAAAAVAAQLEAIEKVKKAEEQRIRSASNYNLTNGINMLTQKQNRTDDENRWLGIAQDELNRRRENYREEQAIEADTAAQIKKWQDERKEKIQELQNKIHELVSTVKNAVNNVINIIKSANNILNKSVKYIINAFNSIEDTIKRIIKLFGNFGNALGKLFKDNNKSTNLLKGSWTELKSAIDLVSGAFNKLINNDLVKESKKLIGSINYLSVIIGTDLTNSTVEWAEEMENVLGMDAAQLLNQLSQVESELYALGMNTRNIATAGKGIVTEANVLTAITGIDTNTAINKLNMGMRGMSRSLAELGIYMNNNEINRYLKELQAQGGEYANITTNINDLTEAQKSYVRYYVMMDKLMKAYTPERYAKSLETLTGRLYILNNQLAIMKQNLANFFGALLNKALMPIIGAIVKLNAFITDLLRKVALLLHLDWKPIDNSMAKSGDEGKKGAEGIDDMSDALDDMSDAADKAKGSLDSLDHVSTMSESKNKGSNFDYSKLMDLVDMEDYYAKLKELDSDFIERCKKAWEELIERIKNKIKEAIREFEAFIGRIIDWDFIKSNLYGAWVNIKNTFKNIVEIAKNALKIIGGLIWSIGDDLDFSRLIFKFTKAFERLTKLVAVILDKIGKPIMDMYNKYLSPYVKKFGDWIEDKLNELIAYFNNMIGWWEDPRNKGAIDDWFDNLGKHIKAIIVMFKGLFGGELTDEEKDFLTTGESYEKGFYKMYNTATKVHDAIMGIVVAIKVLAGIPLDLDKDLDRFDKTPNQVKTLIGICQTLHDILKNIWDIVRETITKIFDFNNSGALDWDDLQIALDWIKEKLDRIGDWFHENKETIINLLSNAAKTVGKIGEAKFEIVFAVLQFITDHADVVNKVLDAIQTLLDLVIKHPIVSLTAAVGLQVAGHVVKGIVTAAIWKSILGIGTGGTLWTALAGVGTKIVATISGGIKAVASNIYGIGLSIGNSMVGGIAAALASVTALISSICMTAAAGVQMISDGAKEDALHMMVPDWDLYKVDQTAYKMREALEQVYGKEIPIDGVEKSLSILRADLERTGQHSEMQMDAIIENVRTQYEELADAREGFFGKTHELEQDIAYKGKDTQQYINNWAQAIKGYSESTAQSTEKAGNSFTKLSGHTHAATSEMMNSMKGLGSQTKGMIDDVEQASGDMQLSIRTNQEEIDKFKDSVRDIQETFSTLFKQMGTDAELGSSKVATAMYKMQTVCSNVTVRIMSAFRSIANSIRNSCSSAASAISQLVSRMNSAMTRLNTMNSRVSTNFGGVSTSLKTTSLRGFASGGIPNSGSLFMANENGNTELVGNFGGYTGVANQSMIIEAMQNAMVQAIRSAGGMGNGGTTNNYFQIGNWLGDDASVRKLANRINTVNAKSNSNIANVGFVMS